MISSILFTYATCKHIGTDEKAIISVVAYRSNDQRQQIKIKFKSLYGKVKLHILYQSLCNVSAVSIPRVTLESTLISLLHLIQCHVHCSDSALA